MDMRGFDDSCASQGEDSMRKLGRFGVFLFLKKKIFFIFKYTTADYKSPADDKVCVLHVNIKR